MPTELDAVREEVEHALGRIGDIPLAQTDAATVLRSASRSSCLPHHTTYNHMYSCLPEWLAMYRCVKA